MAGRGTMATIALERARIPFTVFCSGGRRGLEIELAPADLVRAASATVASIGSPARP